MKNKAIAFFLTLCMMLALQNAAFADGEIINIITTNNVETIPIYGYIGPDADIIDPTSEIYVEVPVKILFAAFESDVGEITSPQFTITNLSTTNNIKVEIESFEQRFDPAINLDGNLSLTLLNDNNEVVIHDLFPSTSPPEKLLCENLSAYEEESANHQLIFTIGGIWNGTFDNKLHPVFDITIKFSAID